MGTASGMPSSLARRPGSLLERVLPELPEGRSTEQPPPVPPCPPRCVPGSASVPCPAGQGPQEGYLIVINHRQSCFTQVMIKKTGQSIPLKHRFV